MPSHLVDLHVGARLRLRRRALGLSQSALADAVGLTFQQLQKYERGANRISASKLFAFAAILTVPVGFFFEGLPDPTVQDGQASQAAMAVSRTTLAFLETPEGQELARRFPSLPKPARRQILDLIHAVADEAGET